jgi:2-aminoethylphosphonate-pyruvate transaminase
MVKRNILLNPGPATTTDTVKYAQIVPDICPREKEFTDLMSSVIRDLTDFADTSGEYTAVMFGGSGTSAVEAIISSTAGKDSILIVNNGAYGKRMCDIAEIYGLNFIEFKSKSYEPLDLDSLESVIKENSISHIGIVHNETTTGLLNDIEATGRICKKYNIMMIVDGVSSYGAIPVNMKEMNITYLAGCSNKNLQAMPGVSFVIARIDSLEKIKSISPRNLYLNLYLQYDYFKRTGQMRFTPPVQTIYSLKQAIKELKKEGIENRYERYSDSWRTLIKGLEKLGLTYIVPLKHHSRLITAIQEPDIDGYNFQDMHDYFYGKGFTIYPGKLDGYNSFRIANIGDITSKDMEVFLELLEVYLNSKKSC